MKKKLVNRILNILAKIFVIGMCLGVVLVFGFQRIDFAIVFYMSMIGCVSVYLIYKRYNNRRSRLWRTLKKGLGR